MPWYPQITAWLCRYRAQAARTTDRPEQGSSLLCRSASQVTCWKATGMENVLLYMHNTTTYQIIQEPGVYKKCKWNLQYAVKGVHSVTVHVFRKSVQYHRNSWKYKTGRHNFITTPSEKFVKFRNLCLQMNPEKINKINCILNYNEKYLNGLYFYFCCFLCQAFLAFTCINCRKIIGQNCLHSTFLQRKKEEWSNRLPLYK